MRIKDWYDSISRDFTTFPSLLILFQVAGANTRMEALLNDLWAADGMSKTFVVISSVLRRDDSGDRKSVV